MLEGRGWASILMLVQCTTLHVCVFDVSMRDCALCFLNTLAKVNGALAVINLYFKNLATTTKTLIRSTLNTHTGRYRHKYYQLT